MSAKTLASTLERRRFLWDLIDRNWPELWDQPAPLRLSPKLLGQLAGEVMGVFYTDVQRGHDRYWNTRGSVRGNIRTWLTNPHQWSPVVDGVAVARAVEFDWAVIDRLTPLEYLELAERLADMDDPWAINDWRDGFEDQRVPGASLESRHNVSPRRMRYAGGTEQQRGRLQMAVARARRKAVAA